MAVRTGTTQSRGYEQAVDIAVNARNRALGVKQAMAAGSVTIDAIWDQRRVFWGLSQTLNSIKAIPGIGEYAKAQEDDPAYDVIAEWNAFIALIDAFVALVDSSMPTDASGWVQGYKIDAGTQGFVPRTFTPAQTAPLQAALQDIADAVAV